MKTSAVAKKIKPSLTRQLFNMAKDYDDVIDLTLGDPDLGTPECIQMAACAAIRSNKMHYSANAGLIEARKAICQKISADRGISYRAEDNVLVTVGGMEALYLTLLSVVDSGDEVIIFSPYYVNYVQMVEMCGGNPITVNAYTDEGLKVNASELESVITAKTVAIIVNSPNNPTGLVFDYDSLKVIADIAKRNDLLVVSDEVYRTLLFDNTKHVSILEDNDMVERTVLIDSLSKEFSMTGWRIGYACGPKFIIENMTKLQENVAACAPLASQYALIEAYSNVVDNSYILDEFQRRRDFLYNRLTDITELKCLRPEATFYMFVNIEKTNMNCLDFSYELLKKVHVAVVPGIAYGEEYDKFVRIAFTKDINVLSAAADRIGQFIEDIHK